MRTLQTFSVEHNVDRHYIELLIMFSSFTIAVIDILLHLTENWSILQKKISCFTETDSGLAGSATRTSRLFGIIVKLYLSTFIQYHPL